jgi:esterase/lipase superfamily enzyme
VLGAAALHACAGPKQLTLMETPVIYHGGAVDPFAHLGEDEKTTASTVFFATNRTPNSGGHPLPYGNSITSEISLGRAVVRLGDEKTDWETLHAASVKPSRAEEIPVTLGETTQVATLSPEAASSRLSPGQQRFVDEIDRQLAAARDKDIMLYVHGTKVDFLNACALAAEVDHFAGRDFVGIAFAWPSHQNILRYLSGTDVRRARDSAPALAALITFLADHTDARRINLLSYSAGCRVASLALTQLRQAHADLSVEQLQNRFRVGASIFAAADVPVDVFQERIKPVSEISEQVVVTVSDHDTALISARRFMGGKARAGSQAAELLEEARAMELALENIEFVDVSRGQDDRGFDITGHHYWYRHPWVSSDVVLTLRTNLPPHRRGLIACPEHGTIWVFPAEYPREVRKATSRALAGQW